MSADKKIRVGSRKSELALIQTRHVITLLQRLHPDFEFEIVTMSTLGDKILDVPLPKIGEKSLFTKELETALATGCVDFVVHSLKDLPTVLPDGMAIGAILQREDPRDALVVRHDLNYTNLSNIPPNCVIGTSSLRRTAQLSRQHPGLKIESIRGNLNTRLRKLDELDKFHAIVLAQAGLCRMGWKERITKILDTDEMLYAVGQGALAVECRENNTEILSLLQQLHDPETVIRVVAERSFLRTLGGGCSAPVAVSTLLSPLDDKLSLKLSGGVWSLDGKIELIETDKCTVEVKKEMEKPRTIDKTPYGGESSKPVQVNRNAMNLKRASESNEIQCPYQTPCQSNNNVTYDIPNKRQKMDDKLNLLNDPHDHCPVNIPVGADFMGKCPYLDQHGNKCPFNAELLNSSGEPSTEHVTKCPYLKENTNKIERSIDANKHVENLNKPEEIGEKKVWNREAKLYVGIVPCKRTPLWALEQAEHLGINLAEKLMQKGALEVMKVAQAVIRGTHEKS